ncbi:hypothetical protein Syn7502_03647 (plasmid) [Synechococcus sp. PCC 7502]|uniref:hypothetical protein n=1 Tax=Synechococcus sp. PCC 7502 TaxID=1173263 RepID=UPI00029FA73D|nr:hypothetical protein [Synechococcus sp. PCC 7502]AFY75470.1 hypothetical protein Syn7502_03647 [Synechococcus sp. PCC 7502]
MNHRKMSSNSQRSLIKWEIYGVGGLMFAGMPLILNTQPSNRLKTLLKATILSIGLAIVLPVPFLLAQTETNNPVNPSNNQPINPLIVPALPSPNGFPTYQINSNNPNPNVSPNSVNNPKPPSPNGFPTYQINPNNPNPNVAPNSVNNPKPPSPNGFPTYQINPNNPNVAPNSVNNPKPLSPNGFPTYQINPNPNVAPDNLPNPANGGSKP